MIEVVPEFDKRYRNKLSQTRDFLAAQGVDETRFAIIEFDSVAPQTAQIVLRYGKQDFETGGYLGLITLAGRPEMVARMEFSNATMMLSHLMEKPERIARALQLDPNVSIDDAASILSVDIRSIWREEDAPLSHEEYFMIQRKQQGDYALCFHERGDAWALATSECAAMIALCFACECEMQETDLASRRAAFRPISDG
jgi:hypothetical protein